MNRTKPLTGIRVVELGHILAGPYCSKLLNDAGAEVIKIEYGVGDPYRHMPPFVRGESLWFTHFNAGKKSLALDLKSSTGQKVFWRLVKQSDVIIENLRPGATKRIGIDYEQVKKRNPKIIYCSVSGFGQTGPKKLLPGFDLIAQAEGGLMTITGETKGSPIKSGTYIADFVAGTYAAYAILLALFQRTKTKRGQYVDVALLDSVVSLTGMFASFAHVGFPVGRVGNKDLVTVPYNIFNASDGSIAIASVGDKIFEEFCKSLNLDSLLGIDEFRATEGRAKHIDEIDEKIQTSVKEMKIGDLVARLERGDIPYCRVPEKIEELIKNKQIQERGMLKFGQHPRMGEIIRTGVPYKLSSCELDSSTKAPLLGEDNKEILTNLGFSKEAIEKFMKNY